MKILILIASLLLSLYAYSEEPLGSINNPIKCDMPAGEGLYLSRLSPKKGKKIEWERLYSTGNNKGDLLDLYKNSNGNELYFNMYHPRYIEIKNPKGYRLFWEWSDKYEYINNLIHLNGDKNPLTDQIEIKLDNSIVTVKIEEGLIKGKLSQFYKNGKIKRVSQYKDNRLEGKELWYRRNGKLWAVYHFKSGMLNGLYQYYNEDGKLEDEKIYTNGEPNKSNK